MSIFFALLIAFALLLALIAVMISMATGRNPFDVIEDAIFIYSLHRRQYYRGRLASIKQTIKEIL